MAPRCPVHSAELVRTQDAFPGSPCRCEWWCPRGHAAKVYEVVNAWGEADLRLQPQHRPGRRADATVMRAHVAAGAKLARRWSRFEAEPLRVCGRDAQGFALDA